MTKKSLLFTGFASFFLIYQGAFAWGAYDPSPTYYTYGGDLPSIYDGYTLTNDNRMSGSGLYGYGSYDNVCNATVARNLSLGKSGEDVATVQDYLFDQDFLQAQPNGYYGYATQNAVKLFQSRYGIRATGTVGPETRNLINNLICGGDTGVSNSNWNNTREDRRMATVSRVTEIPRTVTDNTNWNSNVNTNFTPNYNNNFVPTSNVNSVVVNPSFNNNNQGNVIPVNVNRAPTVTIVIPLNKSFYKEGDVIPATWVTSNMRANRFTLMLTNTSTGLEKRIAALPGDMRKYDVTLTKEILDGVCAGTTACTGLNSNSYRMYVIAHYQTEEGELAIRAYADQVTISRPQIVAQIALTPSKNPVTVGDTIKLFAYVPNSPVFTQYQNLYWKIRANCAPGVTLMINGQSCGSDIYVYQANINTSPDISLEIKGNLWGPTEVTLDATALSYYGGQELGRAQTKILVNK
jgi:peptidoglycan hydrolase-like protein with peptidoglycan-binding domain